MWQPHFLLMAGVLVVVGIESVASSVLLFQGSGSDAAYSNQWQYWYMKGGPYMLGTKSGKRKEYDSAPLKSIILGDASGRSMTFALNGAYAGKTLQAIVSSCMGTSSTPTGNTNSAQWVAGHCNVGTRTSYSGSFPATPLTWLRMGVGDGSSDLPDWALFYPFSGNGVGNFNSNGAWNIGGENILNNGYAGLVYIRGDSTGVADPIFTSSSTSTTVTTTTNTTTTTTTTTTTIVCPDGTLVDFRSVFVEDGSHGNSAGRVFSPGLCFQHNRSDLRSEYTIAAALAPQSVGIEGYPVYECSSTTSSTSTTLTTTTFTNTTSTSTTGTSTTNTFKTKKVRPNLCIDLADVNAAIPSPYAIKFDGNATGMIKDGGNDMYDSGNLISTSLCSTPFAPYTPSMHRVPSDCFGRGGSHYMDFQTYSMAVISQNFRNAETETLSIKIDGDLGVDGNGKRTVHQFTSTSGKYAGYVTTTCGGGDPSVNHLFIVDKNLSPNAFHTNPPTNTDFDTDEVGGIGSGSPIIYVLYAGAVNSCMSESQHRSVFAAAVDSIAPCNGIERGTHTSTTQTSTTVTSITTTTRSTTTTTILTSTYSTTNTTTSATTTSATTTSATTTTTTTLKCQPIPVNVCASIRGTLQVDNTPCLAPSTTVTTTTTTTTTTISTTTTTATRSSGTATSPMATGAACPKDHPPVPVSFAFEFDFFVTSTDCNDPTAAVPDTWNTFLGAAKREAASQRVHFHYDGTDGEKIVKRFVEFRAQFLETLRKVTSSTATTTTATTTTTYTRSKSDAGEDVGEYSSAGEAKSGDGEGEQQGQRSSGAGLVGGVVAGILALALLVGFAFWRHRKHTIRAASAAGGMDGTMYMNTIPMTQTATLRPDKAATSNLVSNADEDLDPNYEPSFMLENGARGAGAGGSASGSGSSGGSVGDDQDGGHLVVISETVNPGGGLVGQVDADGVARSGTDVVTSMLTVRSNRTGSSSQAFIVPMMSEASPARQSPQRNSHSGDSSAAAAAQQLNAALEQAALRRSTMRNSHSSDGSATAPAQPANGAVEQDAPCPIPRRVQDEHNEPDNAASDDGIELYEPYDPSNSPLITGTAHPHAVVTSAAATSSDNTMHYSDPSNQELYEGTSATNPQHYSETSRTIQQMYAEPSNESGEELLDDYVNSAATAGFVGIVGAPPSRAHNYENATLDDTNA